MKELASEEKQKLQKFNECFIPYPVITSIFDDFDRLRLNKELGAEPQCMLITGDTGSGKSSLVKAYQSKVNCAACSGFVSVPLLVSRIPAIPCLESTLVELLNDLGQFGSENRKQKKNEKNLTLSLIKLLKRCKTELIIITEFQELIEFKNGTKLLEIANRLKYISEDSGIPIVLVGMPWAAKIAEEPQWNSRLMIKRNIPYFKLSKGIAPFVQMLKGFANRMPLREVPKLENEKTALALFAASDGCLRTLKNILNEALKQAFYMDETTLTNQHLSCAYQIFFPDEPDPFKLEANLISIREVVEYSRLEINKLDNEVSIIPTQFTDKLPLSQLLTKSKSKG